MRGVNIMQLSISKWGNSQGIRLPVAILKKAGINQNDGTKLDVEVKDDEIIIKQQKSDLAKLFDGFDLEKYYQQNPVTKTKNREVDWGEPVGDEFDW